MDEKRISLGEGYILSVFRRVGENEFVLSGGDRVSH